MNAEKNKLLPCSFCGKEAMIRNKVVDSSDLPRKAYDIRVEWGVGCSNRDCPLSCVELQPLFRRKCDYWVDVNGVLTPTKDGEDGRQYVIDAWNTRAN